MYIIDRFARPKMQQCKLLLKANSNGSCMVMFETLEANVQHTFTWWPLRELLQLQTMVVTMVCQPGLSFLSCLPLACKESCFVVTSV